MRPYIDHTIDRSYDLRLSLIPTNKIATAGLEAAEWTASSTAEL